MRGRKGSKLSQKPSCAHFQSKVHSMQTIINCLQNISSKCQLFLQQFKCKEDLVYSNQNGLCVDQQRAHQLELLLNQYLKQDSNVDQSFAENEMKVSNIESNVETTLVKESKHCRPQKSESLVALSVNAIHSCDDSETESESHNRDNHMNDMNESNIINTDITNKSDMKVTKKWRKCKTGRTAKRTTNRTTNRTTKRFYCQFSGCEANFHSRANLLAHFAKHTGEKAFVCEWPGCGKTFPYQRSLDRHTEMVHLKKAKFKCLWDSCGQTFVQKHQLDCHITEAHTGKKRFKCQWPCCEFTTNYLHGFKTHQRTHDGEKTFVCEWPACGKGFPYKRSLDRHMEVIHLKTTRYRCEWPSCEQSFITKSHLDCHMTNAHTGQKLYKCQESDCDFETNYLNHLKDHKAKHDPNYVPRSSHKKRDIQIENIEELTEDYINMKTGRPLRRKRRPKNYTCNWPNCDYSFESPNALEKHERTHTGERPYACEWPACDSKFRYKQTLKVHMEMVHLKLKRYQCLWPGCDSKFVSLKQLEVHTSHHSGRRKFQCDWPDCDWIGTNHAQELRFHKLRKHEGIKIRTDLRSRQMRRTNNENTEKRHVCEQTNCGKKFKYKSLLTQHSRTHRISGEKLFVCNYFGCEKRFSSASGLSRHRIVHNPNKKFVCDWPGCQSTYRSKDLLEQHVNAQHTGHRPYQCPDPECDAKFSYKSSQRKHYMNCHQLNEKPFHCQFPDCHKKFMEKRSLESHINKKHNSLNNDFSSEKSESQSQPQPQPQLQRPLEAEESESHISRIYETTSQTNIDSIKANLLSRKSFIDSNVFPNDYLYKVQDLSQESNQLMASYSNSNATHFKPEKQTSHINRSKCVALISSDNTTIIASQMSTKTGNETDMKSVNDELPNPCTHSGCWRRFKTEKALFWHLKKSHKT